MTNTHPHIRISHRQAARRQRVRGHNRRYAEDARTDFDRAAEQFYVERNNVEEYFADAHRLHGLDPDRFPALSLVDYQRAIRSCLNRATKRFNVGNKYRRCVMEAA